MSFTETTTTSWFTRLKGALWKIVIGFVLILAAIYFLFTNEGRAIQTYRSLVEGAGLVISADSARVDPANEGKLVHITGPVKAVGDVTDKEFEIAAPGALALGREVEMYQWVEKTESKTEKKLGGGEETVTTYNYVKDWSSRAVDSSGFKKPAGHQNPDFYVASNTNTVTEAEVGAFRIEGERVAALGSEQPVMLNEADAERLSGKIATTRPVRINQGELYVGTSVSSPQVGDMRIKFSRTDLGEASFVGAQKGKTIEPYKTSNGRTIFLSAAGEKDASMMFDSAQSANTMMTWLIRAGGLLAIFIGFTMLFGILGVIGDVIPFVGSIVRGGTTVVALILTLVIGPIVIAIGWFTYRPLIAAAIIGAGLLMAIGLAFLRRKKAASVDGPISQPEFGRG